MELSNENKSINTTVIGTIEKIMAKAPANGDTKAYLTKSLKEIYGESLTNKILNNLPADFFGPEVENIEPVITEDKKTNKTRTRVLLGAIAAAGIVLGSYFLTEDGTEKEEGVLSKLKNKIEKVTQEKEPVNQKFNKEVYESLPEQGKEIYKEFSERELTPGRSYAILDKETAIQYVFDEKNNLVSKTIVGFGKDAGDEPNTSVHLGHDKGTMTTPAGVYLISSTATPEDIKEYGKLQISLYGISVLGNQEFLGEHQTYAQYGEYEPRTKKLQSPSVNDNDFSNGCINVDAKDFEKNIAPYFKQDYGELLFILQDSVSKESRVKYNVKELIEKIAPMIILMANKQEQIILNEIAECSLKERIQKEKTLLEIRKKREAAEKILVKNI